MSLFSLRRERATEGSAERTTAGVSALLPSPVAFIVLGLVLILSMTVMLFFGSAGEQDNDQALEQGQRVMSQVLEAVVSFNRVLEDEQVMELARMAFQNPEIREDMERYITGRIHEVIDIRLFQAEDYLARLDTSGEQAFIILDMLLSAHDGGKALVQSFDSGERKVVAGAVAVKEEGEELGVLLVTANAGVITSSFNATMPEAGYIALEQANGRFAANTMGEFGDADLADAAPRRLPVPGSLFRVVIPRANKSSAFPAWLRLLVFVLGGASLAYGLLRRQLALHPVRELEEDPATLRSVPSKSAQEIREPKPEPKPEPEAGAGEDSQSERPRLRAVPKVEPASDDEVPPPPAISLEDVNFDP